MEEHRCARVANDFLHVCDPAEPGGSQSTTFAGSELYLVQ